MKNWFHYLVMIAELGVDGVSLPYLPSPAFGTSGPPTHRLYPTLGGGGLDRRDHGATGGRTVVHADNTRCSLRTSISSTASRHDLHQRWEGRLYDTLGVANVVTLTRGEIFAAVAGFAAVESPRWRLVVEDILHD